MTIIVTKTRTIIYVVGSYFYDKKYDRKWAFRPGRAETHLHDILWAVHNGKNCGRSEGEENFGEFPVTVGGRGRAMHGGLRISLVDVRACVRGVGL